MLSGEPVGGIFRTTTFAKVPAALDRDDESSLCSVKRKHRRSCHGAKSGTDFEGHLPEYCRSRCIARAAGSSIKIVVRNDVRNRRCPGRGCRENNVIRTTGAAGQESVLRGKHSRGSVCPCAHTDTPIVLEGGFGPLFNRWHRNAPARVYRTAVVVIVIERAGPLPELNGRLAPHISV